MKISTKFRYGLKAMIYIAEKSKENKLVRIKEISNEQNISVQYLEQILYKLKNENIIEGKRGPNGGYRLVKDPKEINLHQLYMILDEEEKVIDCNETRENRAECPDHFCIGAKCIWSKLDRAITEILKSESLEEYIKNNKDR